MVVDAAKESVNPPSSRFAKDLSRHFSRGMSVPVESKPMHIMLTNLLKQLGVDVAPSTNATAASSASTFRASTNLEIGDGDEPFSGTVMMPTSLTADDLYTRSGKNNREVMVLRMEKIFDEVDMRLQMLSESDGDDNAADMLDDFSSELEDGSSENRMRHLSKPVVIGDSIPPPLNCPATVQHVRSISSCGSIYTRTLLIFFLVVA